MNGSRTKFAVLVVLVAAVALVFWLGAKGYLEKPTDELVGGQTDEHGCLIAAGYSWCDASNSCIRPWEKYCTSAPPKTALFECEDSKTITADFYPGDDKFVDLRLGDGRNMSVPRAMSASGARYANADESFVFWNKGDTAFITEGASTTFSGCVTKAD